MSREYFLGNLVLLPSHLERRPLSNIWKNYNVCNLMHERLGRAELQACWKCTNILNIVARLFLYNLYSCYFSAPVPHRLSYTHTNIQTIHTYEIIVSWNFYGNNFRLEKLQMQKNLIITSIWLFCRAIKG